MISIEPINEKEIDLCYKFDSDTISLWSKKQWAIEIKKEGTKVFGLLFENILIGICVLQVVLDEAQIHYFAVNKKFRQKGYGSFLMSYLIKRCQDSNVNKILLEVSKKNNTAEKFYDSFDFSTVGMRRNYYKDGSDAILKEKKLVTK